jgi:hypothetical protein
MKITEKLYLSRRSLLVGTGLLLLGGGAFRFRGRAVDSPDFIARIVSRKADYVMIPEPDLRRFAEDYAKKPNWRITGLLRSRWLNLFYSSPDLFRGPVFAAYQEQLEVLERIVVTDFLMATDYFSGETKPGKVLRYQGLQKGVCSNPFAVFT